jgi:DNA polymerase-3 subunit epsilon
MEFLAVDTETNGRGGDLCEVTEVGCVLVGGGEPHEEWSSLVCVERPLSRGIQRFTGITQAMVDGAPPPSEVLPALAEQMRRRVLVAHNASFDRRVLKQAFERAEVPWPDPPVLCTVAMGRRFAPLARQRKLALLAESLGIEVEDTHRALPDALTCARIFCALFPKLCANAASLADALRLLGPRRRSPRRAPAAKIPRERRPDLSKLPDDPGVYVFRNEAGQPLYVGKSVAVRSRARAHFCQPGDWTGQAEVVDYVPTNSELGALILENRLIKRWRPPGNRALKRTDRWAYVVCRLDIPYPVLEVASEPASGRAVNIGPVKGRVACQELADQVTSLFQLRHCGRKLVVREHPSLYGQMGRCVSPCLGDLDPNAYRRRLDEALALFDGPDGAERLIARCNAEMERASAERHYERAAVMRDRRDRIARLLERLGGLVRAVHAGSRVVLSKHPVKPEWDLFWVAGGRVARWGPLGDQTDVRARAAALSAHAAPPVVARDEVHEVRIVSSWLAGDEAWECDLVDGVDVAAWVEQVTGVPLAADDEAGDAELQLVAGPQGGAFDAPAVQARAVGRPGGVAQVPTLWSAL